MIFLVPNLQQPWSSPVFPEKFVREFGFFLATQPDNGLPMPSENWDTTSCVHPLHYLPSERRVAPCPPKARSADLSCTCRSFTDRIMTCPIVTPLWNTPRRGYLRLYIYISLSQKPVTPYYLFVKTELARDTWRSVIDRVENLSASHDTNVSRLCGIFE